jgi:hypothetical protein
MLFFLWAFGVDLNDVLIPHLKKVVDLTDFRSSLIQTAFCGGYSLSSVPAGAAAGENREVMERVDEEHAPEPLAGNFQCRRGYFPSTT